MGLTDEELAALLQLEAQATPGDWEVFAPEGGEPYLSAHGVNCVTASIVLGHEQHVHNALTAAHARNALRPLVEEVRRLRAELATATARANELPGMSAALAEAREEIVDLRAYLLKMQDANADEPVAANAIHGVIDGVELGLHLGAARGTQSAFRPMVDAREQERRRRALHLNLDNAREVVCGTCGEHALQVCTHIAAAPDVAEQRGREAAFAEMLAHVRSESKAHTDSDNEGGALALDILENWLAAKVAEPAPQVVADSSVAPEWQGAVYPDQIREVRWTDEGWKEAPVAAKAMLAPPAERECDACSPFGLPCDACAKRIDETRRAVCSGNRCNFADCQRECVEKVETDQMGRYGHPLTAYVCAEHYAAIMHGGKGARAPEEREGRESAVADVRAFLREEQARLAGTSVSNVTLAVFDVLSDALERGDHEGAAARANGAKA